MAGPVAPASSPVSVRHSQPGPDAIFCRHWRIHKGLLSSNGAVVVVVELRLLVFRLLGRGQVKTRLAPGVVACSAFCGYRLGVDSRSGACRSSGIFSVATWSSSSIAGCQRSWHLQLRLIVQVSLRSNPGSSSSFAPSPGVQRQLFLPAHCLNKTTLKNGSRSPGGKHKQNGETGVAGNNAGSLPSVSQRGQKPYPWRTHRGGRPLTQAWYQAAGSIRGRPREGPCRRGTAHVTTRRSVPGKHQTIWTCSVPRLQCSTRPLPVHLLNGPTVDLQEFGQFPLAHSLRSLYPDVLPLLLGQAGPTTRETALGPRLRLAGDRALPDRVPPPLAEGEHHRELELTGGTWPCRSLPPGTGTPLPHGVGPRSPVARR